MPMINSRTCTCMGCPV